MRKICIFTATRAEWGLFSGIAQEIRNRHNLELKLLVSGTHLSRSHGGTASEIEAAGFTITEGVEILKFEDSATGICKTMGEAMGRYGEALENIRPDVLLVLGDRYEAFCAAAVAQVLRIAVAHIHGGETTQGAIDEAFRHSITKMSHIHFPACEEYKKRIIQLGEQPNRVFNVGALGVENIRKVSLMSLEDLSESIGLDLGQSFFLVTFHPVTLERSTAGDQFENLLVALGQFPDHKIIITGANADTDGSVINSRILSYTKSFPNRCVSVESLGLRRYLTAMKYCDAVIGNSSSGIIEAPAFGVPTINIGDRQKGRVRAESILDCGTSEDEIVEAIRIALTPEFQASINGMRHPYEQEATASQIVNILASSDLNGLLKKAFYDM